MSDLPSFFESFFEQVRGASLNPPGIGIPMRLYEEIDGPSAVNEYAPWLLAGLGCFFYACLDPDCATWSN
jgi:hypothetical protein